MLTATRGAVGPVRLPDAVTPRRVPVAQSGQRVLRASALPRRRWQVAGAVVGASAQCAVALALALRAQPVPQEPPQVELAMVVPPAPLVPPAAVPPPSLSLPMPALDTPAQPATPPDPVPPAALLATPPDPGVPAPPAEPAETAAGLAVPAPPRMPAPRKLVRLTVPAPARPPAAPTAPPIAAPPVSPTSVAVHAPLPAAVARSPDPRPAEPAAPAATPSASAVDSYEGRVRLAIQAAVRYPPAAAMMGRDGQARVAFTVRSGRASLVHVIRGSGFPVLDVAAVEAVEQAAYPRPPAEIGDRSLTLLVSVEFRPPQPEE